MTQGERIVQYMLDYGSITPMQAFENLGITKLATRIGEMRERGIEIQSEFMSGKNRFGQPVRYKRYFLTSKMNWKGKK